jgi:hypothetical protein
MRRNVFFCPIEPERAFVDDFPQPGAEMSSVLVRCLPQVMLASATVPGPNLVLCFKDRIHDF